ncbi:alpha-galactosidase [Verrucomicrobium sp. GAS474]|uniref:alpha-galactosidase n=1 Tax=Verrucomicrobium sp. GAS474 TaxID=1882831 RepID=UPI00087C5A52|nr:alpha-galactosidase [Verrucomicrobium sp. GAS474]SDU27322.1 alpha-galactosidase [Verrucomicrobium sp. GAS474]
MSLKITLIGAGSVVFAKNLISDVLQFAELSDATLCLMDIDPARLKVAKVMAERIVAALGVKATVTATLDRREAVRGARYVICTVQVGGYKPGTVIDFEIPRKYGLLQTIGDTLGVGGVFRALRTIPVINRIAQDIAEVGAPDCLLLNYTNPMAMNCTAVHRAVGIPHVGLCHSVQGTSQQLATLAGLPFEDVTYKVAGINHMAFFLKFEYKGQDAYPLLFALLDKPGFNAEKVRFEMMRRTGYFVTESSEHQSEYVPYFIHHGKKVIERFDVPIDEYLRRCEAIIGTWEKTEAELLGGKDGIVVHPQSHEYGSYIIHSRETDTPRVIYGNVPNRNLIDNLPAGACVEVPCLVDAQGIQPTHVGTLPPQLAALCQSNINVQDLTVEAALTGKREHIYHAVMMDPHTATVLPLDKIWAMCDDLIEAHQKVGLLGDFAPVIPHTGRAWAGTGDRLIADIRLDEKATSRKKDGTLHAEVVVINPRPKAVTASLELRATPYGSRLSSRPPLKLKIAVPAGKTVRKPVTLPHGTPLSQGLALRLESPSSDILTKDYLVRPRTVLQAGGEGARFELKLAGFPAAEGTLKVKNRSIHFRIAVDDSKITPSAVTWEGSTVELFFAASDSDPITPFFLLPQPGAKKVTCLSSARKPFPGLAPRITPSRKGAGYEIEIEIPFATAGISSTAESLLFDVYANVTALGDAHSGGRTSLGGHFDSHANPNHFTRVEFAR